LFISPISNPRRTGKIILERFGGTYESAKTDERKEFKRMLDFVKKHNASKNPNKISQIWVYMTDRFSRTGVGGMNIAEELREKYGVALYALAQPINVSDESGIFSQNMQFLVSHYENRLRRRRMIDGLTAKFEKGEWVTKVPMGYSVIKEKKERKIVVNEVGKKLQKAFLWKAEGMKNEEIILGLRAMGVPMYKQQLTKIFKKPFYCGLINHGMLNGRIVEGNHEKLVLPEIFLKVNDIHVKSSNYGVPHKKERDELPLKVFAHCATCGQPFAGYSRQKQTSIKLHTFYYYKCRTAGCRCNKKAAHLHNLFVTELSRYSVKPELFSSVKYELESYYHEISKDQLEQEQVLKAQLSEINKKIDTIEEKHFALNEMSRETFEKFYTRYTEERFNVTKFLQECTTTISNLTEAIEDTLVFCRELNTVWASGSIKIKEGLQKLIFPNGIAYDRESDAFRTPEVNFIFQLIASLARPSGKMKRGLTIFLMISPHQRRERVWNLSYRIL